MAGRFHRRRVCIFSSSCFVGPATIIRISVIHTLAVKKFISSTNGFVRLPFESWAIKGPCQPLFYSSTSASVKTTGEVRRMKVTISSSPEMYIMEASVARAFGWRFHVLGCLVNRRLLNKKGGRPNSLNAGLNWHSSRQIILLFAFQGFILVILISWTPVFLAGDEWELHTPLYSLNIESPTCKIWSALCPTRLRGQCQPP